MSSLKPLALLTDVVGENDAGEVCHPYANRTGAKKGYFHYRLAGDRNFRPVDEKGLRAMIEAGAFDEEGIVRMAPATATDVERNGELNVREYRGVPRGRGRKC